MPVTEQPMPVLWGGQHIPYRHRPQGLSIFLADGSRIKSGLVTQETPPLPVITSTDHKELLRLDAIVSSLFPVILDLPWLQAHNQQIDWGSGNRKFQSSYCQKHCLTMPPKVSCPMLCLESDSEIHSIPEPYHKFLEVFSKQGAGTLSPHHSYDCSIELLAGLRSPLDKSSHYLSGWCA